MRKMNETDVQGVLRDLRSLEPSPNSWSSARARVARALAAPRLTAGRARGRLVLLPSAAAALVVMVALFWLMPSGSRALASHFQQAMEHTTAFEGWVALVPSAVLPRTGTQTTFQTFNTADGTNARVVVEPERYIATLTLPGAGEYWHYDSHAGVITVTSLDDRAARQAAEQLVDRLHWSTLIDSIREAGHTVDVQMQRDGPWRRFELQHSLSIAGVAREGTDTIWTDVSSGLIQRMHFVRGEEQFGFDVVYRADPVESIYDLGVPSDAPIRSALGVEEPSALQTRVAATPAPATLGMDALLALVQQRHDRLHTFRASYAMRVEPPHPQNVNRGRYELTVSGERLRYEQHYGGDPQQDGYEHHRIAAFDGDHYTRRLVTNRDTYMRSAFGGGDIDPQSTIFYAFHLLNKPRGGDGRSDQSLESLLQSRHSSVRERLELVNGRLCHVIDAPAFTVWLDAERSALPLRQVFRDPRDAGRIRAEFVADRVELVDGLWFITAGRRFTGDARDERFETPPVTTFFEVERTTDGSPAITLAPPIDQGTFDLFHDLPTDLPAWRVHDETR